MKALIVVDVQRDFALTGGSLYVKDGEQIVPGINALIETEEFGVIVFTQDWHPAGHKSFASNNPGKNPFEMGELNGQPQMMWPNHCVKNTDGAKFHPDLKVPSWAYTVRKGINKNVDSYSAFYDNDKRASTGLTDYLKSVEVDEVEILGIAGDFCVNATAEDANKEGFKTKVITNLVKFVDPSSENKDKIILAQRSKGIENVRLFVKDGKVCEEPYLADAEFNDGTFQ